MLMDSALTNRYNQLMSVGVDSTRKNWFLRKIFNEHLVDVKAKDYTFYGDILLENTFGKDFQDKSTEPINLKPLGFGPNARDRFKHPRLSVWRYGRYQVLFLHQRV
jgi:hypothetical protein